MKKEKKLSDEAVQAEAPKRRKKKRRKKKRGPGAGLLITVVLLVLLVIGGGVGAFVAGQNITKGDTNLPNVYVADVYVGKLTQEQTQKALEDAGWNERVGGTLSVELPFGGKLDLDYIQAGAALTADKAAEAAYRYGHDGRVLENLMTYVKGYSKPEDVSTEPVTLNSDYILAQVDEAIRVFEEETADKGYEVDEKNARLVFVKGAGQMTLDRDALYEQIVEALSLGSKSITYTMPESDYGMPDFQALHKKLSAEPRDASYDPETGEIISDVKGVDFSVKEAEKLWNAAEAGARVEIPMTLTYPSVTADELKELLFRDLLGTTTTYYGGSTSNRINNIDLVCQKLDGLVLMPGDEFSYNGYIGERTEEAGFMGAPAYDNGKVVYEIGGGICQVSSTLYNSVLKANLEVLARDCHYFAVGYLPKGLDATVSWPGPDFKFRNNRDYPIRLNASSDHDEMALTIEIWGSNIDGTYVEPKSAWWPTYDATYPDVQTGWGAYSWRYLYDKDGNLLDKIDCYSSQYFLHDEDIQWPAGVDPNADPAAEEPTTTVIDDPAEATPAPTAAPEEPEVVDEPVAETPAPAAEEPPAETPAAEEPSGETPAAEEPAGETPAAEEPAGETPAAEEPAPETPAEEPGGEEVVILG